MKEGSRRELTWPEKQIVIQLNQELLDQYKEHKINLYGALMRCGITNNTPDTYYQCIESVNQKEQNAENRMKKSLNLYQKQYATQMFRCEEGNVSCQDKARGVLKKKMYDILKEYYTSTLF